MIWPTIELLGIDELRALPKMTGGIRRPGVYFLWDDDRLMYIGSSKEAGSRISSHRSNCRFHFNRATWLEIPSPWYAAIEIAYIEKHQPTGNANHNPKGQKRISRRQAWINGEFSARERQN